VKVLSVAGVSPTEENIRRGSYPVQRPFLLVTAGEVSGETADFHAFATSERAREYLSMAGVVWAN
jgi:phosphate transport system substrate-binding protein